MLWIRNVGVHYYNGDEAFALVEDLHIETCWNLTDPGVNEFSCLYVSSLESKSNIGYRLEMRKHIGNNIQLIDTLYDEAVLVGSPFLVCEVAVDWLVHIT